MSDVIETEEILSENDKYVQKAHMDAAGCALIFTPKDPGPTLQENTMVLTYKEMEALVKGWRTMKRRLGPGGIPP